MPHFAVFVFTESVFIMQSSYPQWDLETLSQLFAQAGTIALKYFDSPPTELKSDASVVTAADKEIEELFAGYCVAPARNSYMIGEETIGKYPAEYVKKALQSPCCWVLDPIDGTAPYSSHMDFWGISLGLMSCGVLVEGAVYLPRFDRLIATCNDKLLWRNLKEASSWQIFDPQASPLGPAGHISLGQMPARKWGFAGKNALFSICSCVGSLFLLLTGKVTAYCGDFKLWDIAGMLPILERAKYPILSLAENNPPLSGNLQDNMFELDDPQTLWKVKNPVIAARNKEFALELLNKFYTIEQPAELKR